MYVQFTSCVQGGGGGWERGRGEGGEEGERGEREGMNGKS